jgi:hypothetical protein
MAISLAGLRSKLANYLVGRNNLDALSV